MSFTEKNVETKNYLNLVNNYPEIEFEGLNPEDCANDLIQMIYERIHYYAPKNSRTLVQFIKTDLGYKVICKIISCELNLEFSSCGKTTLQAMRELEKVAKHKLNSWKKQRNFN
ncbi:MAG: hypothetical protein KDD58_02480 [Bdellovibrionales bacterium]|nr:hypothetical protein [Bdellovibrionales bacterium]